MDSNENVSDDASPVVSAGRRLGGRVLCWLGGALLVVSLPLALIFTGAALLREGALAACLALLFCFVPVGLGAWLVQVGSPGFWRRPVRLRDAVRLPGVAGIAIGVVSLALILLLPGFAVATSLVALVVYPLVDAPRTVARPSWWRAAFVSAFVWLVVFVTLTALVDSLRHLGDDMMIYLLPFMLYPLLLALSGCVRLERTLRGRPRESGTKIAALLGFATCVVLVGGPVAIGVAHVAIEKITGNTLGNAVSTAEGAVIASAPGQVSVRLTAGGSESFRIDGATRFGFLGPGWQTPREPAGPGWLKPGQRVELEYAYRAHEAVAKLVTIWIDRKRCADDPRWAGAASSAVPPPASGLAGTTWDGWFGAADSTASPGDRTQFEFLDGGRLAYKRGDANAVRNTDGRWAWHGGSVLVEVNDCYAVYEARIDGDGMKGEFRNIDGAQDRWTARRRPVPGEKAR